MVNDYYQLGRLAYQTNGSGTLLARYTYDLTGAPVSVQVGSNPTTAPRYYYVYDARGDVVNLTDANGTVVASYSYDTWGALTASSESIPNAGGWVNPYRYDGRDRVLADPTTGLDWLATRAYDPSTGRFLARDPLGRAPLFFADNPYAYAGNNPVSNVDPTGQYRAAGHGSAVRESGAATNRMMARVVAHHGTPSKGGGSGAGCGGCKVKEKLEAATASNNDLCGRICKAQQDAKGASDNLFAGAGVLGGIAILLAKFVGIPVIAAIEDVVVGIGGQLALEAGAFYFESLQPAAFWNNRAEFSAASGALIALSLVVTLLVGILFVWATAVTAEAPPLAAFLAAVGVFLLIGAAIGMAADEYVAFTTIDQQRRDLGY